MTFREPPSRLPAPAPRAAPPAPLPAGRHRLASAWLAVPGDLAEDEAVPLLVFLHGAGSSGRAALDSLGALPAEAGALVLAPDSRDATWDVIRGGFGPDVERIGAALGEVREHWDVDPARTVLAGFSDGASYVLSLGIANGDRFSHLVAFSPGFMAPDAAHGKPPVFVSHGTADRVLPIERCSRRLVPALRHAGHEVHYTEFEGGHAIPQAIAREALEWVAGPSAQTG